MNPVETTIITIPVGLHGLLEFGLIVAIGITFG
jgi:hypothetical protein